MLQHAIRLSFEPWKEIEDDHERREAAYEKLTAEIAPALEKLEKDPVESRYVPRYRLTPDSCRAITALLRDLAERKRAKLGCVQITERVEGAAAEQADWFVLTPRTEFDLDGRKNGITRAKADRIKGREPLRQYSNNIFLSEAARDSLAGAKLAGYETFWVADVGKYSAGQWYHLVPTAFVGRGVDHPWFDPATRGQFKRDGFEEVQPIEDPWRLGTNVFEVRQLLKDPRDASPEIKALLAVLRDTPIVLYKYSTNYIDAPLRLLRSHLPRADVGYAWQARAPAEQGRDPSRYARVCVSRKARATMLERRLATKQDFRAVIVLDDPPAGGAVFDGPDAPPAPPVYPADSLKRMRAEEAKLLAKHRAKPKPPAPVKPVPLAPLLGKLKREVKKRGGEVLTGAKAADIAAAEMTLERPIPRKWAQILNTLDGFDLDNCAIFDGEQALRGWSSEQLTENHRSSFDLIRLGWPEMPDAYLAVADSDSGDPIFLDTQKLSEDGDCPVVWVDHETSQTVHTWPSISLFLKDAVEPAERE